MKEGMRVIARYELIRVKFFGPTMRQGSRVSMYNVSTGDKKIIPYDYRHDSARQVATAYYESKGFEVVQAIGDDKLDYLIVISPKPAD